MAGGLFDKLPEECNGRRIFRQAVGGTQTAREFFNGLSKAPKRWDCYQQAFKVEVKFNFNVDCSFC